MADTKTTNRNRNRNRGGSRLGPIGDSIRERPLATAAVATAAAAAGAFFFARRSGVTTDTVAKWGQDARVSLGSLTGGGQADSDNAQQDAISGTRAKTGTPSSSAASKLAATGTSGTSDGLASGGESGGTPAPGKTSEARGTAGGNTGLDSTSKDQTEVGSVAYGA